MAAGKAPDDALASAGEALKQEAVFGADLLRRYGWRLLLVFAGLLLPLWGFAELADEIHEQEATAFDAPMLLMAHSLAGQGLDRTFLIVSALGYGFGVLPFDLLLAATLALRRRVRETVFVIFALGGSLLLNALAKPWFARDRPSLWESISPHSTYSFPSGHAMASATLACVLIALAWRTRWRWSVIALAVPFVLLVGYSRIYLGVHYPSDILAGWAAATAWALAAYLVVFRGGARPWRSTTNLP